MISGSVAMNYYAVPRMTRDIDIVVELNPEDGDKFIRLFQKDFYIDEEMVEKSIKKKSLFNIIHNKYVFKIDFIVKGKSKFHDISLSRRKKVLIDDNLMWFISAEDLILAKLLWAKESYSELQLSDIKNLFEGVLSLDKRYIKENVFDMGLEEILRKVENE